MNLRFGLTAMDPFHATGPHFRTLQWGTRNLPENPARLSGIPYQNDAPSKVA